MRWSLLVLAALIAAMAACVSAPPTPEMTPEKQQELKAGVWGCNALSGILKKAGPSLQYSALRNLESYPIQRTRTSVALGVANLYGKYFDRASSDLRESAYAIYSAMRLGNVNVALNRAGDLDLLCHSKGYITPTPTPVPSSPRHPRRDPVTLPPTWPSRQRPPRCGIYPRVL